MNLDWVRHLIADYGVWFYVITFVWTLIEGETFVIYAGVLAAQGLLDAPLLFLCAWIGSFCGDQIYFWLGRRFGARFVRDRPKWRERIDKVDDWLKKYDALFIMSFRWLYGIRNFASIGLGMTDIHWSRFFRLNLIAAAVWAAGFIGLGYGAGIMLRPLVERLAHHFTLVMLGIFAFMFTLVFVLHKSQAFIAARRTRSASREGAATESAK